MIMPRGLGNGFGISSAVMNVHILAKRIKLKTEVNVNPSFDI